MAPLRLIIYAMASLAFTWLVMSFVFGTFVSPFEWGMRERGGMLVLALACFLVACGVHNINNRCASGPRPAQA